MKISLAQIRSAPGDIEANIGHHLRSISVATAHGADAIFFPELSLSGYEPRLAGQLATTQDDPRLDVFQEACDAQSITIGIGLPLKGVSLPKIGMVIFRPRKSRQVYCKQKLHDDELPFFVAGEDSLVLTFNEHWIAPAICYESLLPSHADAAVEKGASIYIASVAKSARGLEKAFAQYPVISGKHSMVVLMCNCVGPSDDFVGAGRTAAWNRQGELMGQLDNVEEGVLIFDIITEEALIVNEQI